jgi:acyl-coenzyme A thioesterase PaaI-like protein
LTSDRQVLVLDGEPVEINAHNCFACGTLNANGLQLDLHLEQARSWTEVTLARRCEGWDGNAHGGIVAAILHEVMAWALIATDAWGMTARMNVDFRAPVEIGRRIRADGELVESRRRLFRTRGRLMSADGATLATADATYVAAPEGRRRELQRRYGFSRFSGRTGAERSTPVLAETR